MLRGGPIAAALAGVLFVVAACGEAAPERPRSALILTLDTTRYDALTFCGGPAGASPNLDALAAESLVYDRARTVAPLTMPSHASILTGLVPLRHTVHTNSTLALPASATTIAERARERGFQTGAFVAAVVLDAEFGLAQGFDAYDQPTAPAVQTQRQYDRRPGDEVADAAIAWIDSLDPEQPFLAWAHFFDPHLPYEPAPEFVEQVGAPGYHADVAAMDHAIGRILDALKRRGLFENTAILVVADHGEALGDHGEDTHGTLAYDSTIHVPMIVRLPDPDSGSVLRAGERSDEVVSVVDVYPTLVEALSLGAADDVDGLSLYRRRVPADRGVYVEAYYGFFSFGWSPLVGWADARGKYLHSSEPEFFAPGGGEARNAIDELAPADLERYRDAIARLAERPKLSRDDDDATTGVIDKLRALGYTGAGGDPLGLPPPLAPTDRPSPASMRETYRMLLAAAQLADAGRLTDAITLYRKVVAANPENADAWFQLGGALVNAAEDEQDLEESLAASKRAMALGSRWYGVLKNVGIAQQRLGRPEEALAAYTEALETAPKMIDVLRQCAALCEQLGRTGEQQAFLLRVIEAQADEQMRAASGERPR